MRVSRRAALAGAAVFGAACAASASAAASPADAPTKPAIDASRAYCYNVAAPRVTGVEDPFSLGALHAARRPALAERLRRHSGGFPAAARALARREAVAARTGASPAAQLR